MRRAFSSVASAVGTFALCCAVACVGCAMKPVVRVVADEVQLGGEWLEIRPDPPLEVSRQVQRISIDVPDVADWDMRPETASFVMPDGTAVKIDVELVATDGTRITLDSVGLGPGLTFSRRPAESGDAGSRISQDLEFSTIRLRSDTPLKAGRLEWICITNY
jgi:hypothetical protein